MSKAITYPDSGGSYTRKAGDKLDQVHATEQLPAVPDTGAKEQPVAPAPAPAVTKSKES